jgi:hypothetical protein
MKYRFKKVKISVRIRPAQRNVASERCTITKKYHAWIHEIHSLTHSHLGDILVSEEQSILGDHPLHVKEGILVLGLIVVAHTVVQTGNHSTATGPLRGPA